MIDTKALRSRVLDLAIQGKLTEQLESDGTAEELYQQIQGEKKRLVKECKIRKEKSFPEIKLEEVPFEIPESWKWCRLGECIRLQSGQDYKPEDYNDNSKGTPYLTGASNIDTDGSLIINRWTEKPTCIAETNDVLIVCKGSGYGKITICSIEYAHIARQFMAVKYSEFIDSNYMKWYLISKIAIIKENGQGLIPGIDRTSVLNLTIPLPPIAEQKRIVARVEEIFRLLDTIDEAQKRYTADAEILKAKLITAGIQGKLTEQLNSDGTAEELYQQIQEEKQRLIKEGKIKKEKPLPEIKPEEIPFEIPGSWKWVRLNEICKSVMDGDHQPPPQTTEGMSFIVISNLSNGVLDFSNTRHVPQNYFNSLSSERIAEHGDILFTVTGSFGIAIKVDTDQKFCFQRHIALLKSLDNINTDYLLHVLKSEFVYKQCDHVALGVAQRTVGIKPLRNFLIPLPPLAEQKRIAERLDAVLETLG